jgi:DNA-binding HxlR family transcriptional regulator
VQVRYRLTPRGSDLMASLQPLVAWGQRWVEPAATHSSGLLSSAGAVADG